MARISHISTQQVCSVLLQVAMILDVHDGVMDWDLNELKDGLQVVVDSMVDSTGQADQAGVEPTDGHALRCVVKDIQNCVIKPRVVVPYDL